MSDIAKYQLRRSIIGQSFTAAVKHLTGAGDNNDWLLDGVVYQSCQSCAAVFYPPQPLCQNCLSEDLIWRQSTEPARLISFTELSISFNDLYRGTCPWSIGLVAHTDQNNVINVYAFLDEDVTDLNQPVQLFTVPDVIGEAVFIAIDVAGDVNEKARRMANKLLELAAM